MAGLARSTYYCQLKILDRPDPHAALKLSITASLDDSKHRHGYRRVLLDAKGNGWTAGKKLVLKLMRMFGFRPKAHPKRRYNSYKGEQGRVAENLLDRQFDVASTDTVYVSDVTEFRPGQGKLYLSSIMDPFDRSILSFTLATSPTTAFTSESLATTLGGRSFEKKLLVHTDQGLHYQHSSWKNLLEEHGAVQSMSRKDNCHGNSVMEIFFGHLKSEMFYRQHFQDLGGLRMEIDRYIHWYDTKRRQERLKGMAPMDYRCHTLAA